MAERRFNCWQWLVGAALAFTFLEIRAQTIEDISLVPQGDQMVARVTFNATVRFLQQSPVTSTSLYRITFDIVNAEEAVYTQTTEESKRIPASAGVPAFTLSYSPPRPRIGPRQLTLLLNAATLVKVRQGPSSRTIDIAFAEFTSRKPPAAQPAAQAASVPGVSKRYAVTLQSLPIGEADKLAPVPARFKTFDVFTTNSEVDGVPTIEVNLGYFATLSEAEAVKQAALERFPQAKVFDLVRRREDMQKLASAAQPTSAASDGAQRAESPASAAGATPAEMTAVEARADDLMTRARDSLAARRNEEAINSLNQLLLLPPNRYSQEAQELIGLAWERVGDTRRARVEYELYLRLYPQGEGAQRVGQRLASLEGAAAPATLATTTPLDGGKKAPDQSYKYAGNIAQYYYGGKARSQSLVNIAAGIDQSTLTRTTESAIVTSVDLGGRYISPESETRVVVRGTGSVNLVSTSHSSSLLNAAYVDYRRTESGMIVRLGRQSSISGGLLGLFDGASLTYPVSQGWKLDLMGGVPASPLVSAPKERMFAAMVEADGLLEHWGGDVYVIALSTEGIDNRRAIGTELRYSDERLSAYSLIDYDTLFRKFNAFTLQGSIQAPSQTTITLLVDSRNAPSLEMTNALISSGAASLKDLLQLQTIAEVRDAAIASTTKAQQAMVSVSKPVSEKWQLAMDLRYSAIGALPAVGNFEPTPATGAQYGATMQLTGSNLYSSRDINNFNLSVITTPSLKGMQASYNNLTGFNNNDITVEPGIRFYTQRDNQGVKLFRISPGIRGTYRLSPRGSLLGEGIVEHSKANGPTNSDTINSIFFYAGYRYELF